ncbi:DUF2651 family protein [Halobacillus sp. B29]|uniref:DUF2651 family protein n=1 Tax=Halobacillus sp. B29 TaxID=3457432 RepID=UPI003FCDAF45
MYVIPLVLFIFPMLAFVIGVLGRSLFKKLFLAPAVVFGLSLLAQLLYFNSSFFMWILIYTSLAIAGSLTAHFLLRTYHPSRNVQKTAISILLGAVLIPALIFVLSRPVNAALMEKKVEKHLRLEEYSTRDITSIETFYEGKRNTNRTKPVIAEVVFTDDPHHTYRYIELKKENRVVQMCEYERSPNFFTNEYTAERPHMKKDCLE